MLSPCQLEQVTIIVQFASDCLAAWGYKEFVFKSLDWDESRGYWIVGFLVVKEQQIRLGIQPSLNNSYRYGGIIR